MKKLVALILASAFIAPAMAAKPEMVGKDKASTEQKAAHKSAMNAKDELDIEKNELKEKKAKKEKPEELKGMEKQSAKKSAQTQNELDKGSDKGKAARAENSKKWWKFWGD